MTFKGCLQLLFRRSAVVSQKGIHGHHHAWRTKPALRAVCLRYAFLHHTQRCPDHIFKNQLTSKPDLTWVQRSFGAPDAFNRGYRHAVHGAKRSEARVDGEVLNLAKDRVVAGHHNCTRPTPTLSTPQL